MSKKQFTSGLDSVFSAEAQYEPNIDESPWLLETSVATKGNASKRRDSKGAAQSGKKRPARRPGKSFTSDLDSLFAAASVEQPREAIPSDEDLGMRGRNRPRRRAKILSGLDSLIRDTTNGKILAQQQAAAAQETPVRKRVTFTYDRERFARLKSIARTEGAYLKDIISGLLNEYIQQYESERGPIGT